MRTGGVLELERLTLDYSTATLLNLSQPVQDIDSYLLEQSFNLAFVKQLKSARDSSIRGRL